MSRKLIGNADVEAGAFFAVFGAVTAALSMQYKLGTAAEMGPGFFPLMLGICLTLVGIAILAKGLLVGRSDARNFSASALFFIVLSLVAFAALMLTAGLVFAIPALTFISLIASSHFTLLRATAISAGLLVFTYVVFIHFLGVLAPMIAGY